MTLSAVQLYVQSTVNGAQAPGWEKPLVALVAVPTVNVIQLPEPRAFVWGATANEHRLTIPRAAPGVNPMIVSPGTSTDSGWKERVYSVSMWVYGLELSGDKQRATKFPVLIEQVLNSLRMASIPATLTDPTTGEQSVLLSIGEELSWEYDVDRTLADQRLVRNECRIDASVIEQMQF